MNVPSVSDTAHVVAKLLKRRPTRQEELPEILHSVHAALQRLSQPQSVEAPEDGEVFVYGDIAKTAAASSSAAPAERRTRRPRQQRRAADAEEFEDVAEQAAAVPAPKLLRRAEVVAPAPAAAMPFTIPSGPVRGVVKWFDLRTRRGALRLPGYSGDVPVEAELLGEMGITRLFKGQEVEAALSGDEAAPRIVKLGLPGGTSPFHAMAGIVRGRQAKPVVVEMKREGLRRVAARAEAEMLLRPNRIR